MNEFSSLTKYPPHAELDVDKLVNEAKELGARSVHVRQEGAYENISTDNPSAQNADSAMPSTSLANSAETTEIEEPKDPTKRATLSRLREFICAGAVGALVDKTIVTPAWTTGASTIEALRSAKAKKSFGIPAPIVSELKRYRGNRDELNRLAQMNTKEPNIYRLIDIVRRYDERQAGTSEDITFLEELSLSIDEDVVRSFGALHLSSELNRRGEPREGLKKLKSFDVGKITQGDKPNHFLQLINLSYSLSSQASALKPDQWGLIPLAKQVSVDFGDELGFVSNPDGNVSLPSFADPQILRNVQNLGGIYPHITFFMMHYRTASSNLSDADRRAIWEHQIIFYRKLLDDKVVSDGITRNAMMAPVWNHFLLLALQAHRVGDIEYRNRFLRYGIGDSEFWKQTPIRNHILERKARLDPQYIFFAILLETLKLNQQDDLIFLHSFDSDIEYLLGVKSRILNMSARRAIDSFRKKLARPERDAVLLGDYGVRVDSHDSYVLDVTI